MADKNDIVVINLDRPRILWYGHRALKTLTAMTGKSLSDFTDAEEDVDFEDLEKLLYCGLLSDAKRNNETLRLEDMEDLLDLAPFSEVIEAMGKAFAASFGDMEGVAEKNGYRVAARKKQKK